MYSVFSSTYVVMKYYPAMFEGSPFEKIWRKYKRKTRVIDKLDYEVAYNKFAWALDYCDLHGWTSQDPATGIKFERLIFERFPDGEMTLAWLEEDADV